MENQLRNRILLHLSQVLEIPINEIASDMKFGVDIKSNFQSDFKYNALDILIEDARDVCSGKIAKEWNRGEIIIDTISDYIEHMIRCNRENPRLVDMVIGGPRRPFDNRREIEW